MQLDPQLLEILACPNCHASLRVDDAAQARHGFQIDDHESAVVEADHAQQVDILELARHRFGRFLGIEDAVVVAHAAGLVDDQHHGAILFRALRRLLGLDG